MIGILFSPSGEIGRPIRRPSPSCHGRATGSEADSRAHLRKMRLHLTRSRSAVRTAF